MPRTTLFGHPLHPQLVVYPAGLLPFSFVLDLLHARTGQRSYAQASYYAMVGGTIGALAAGAAGAMDYLAIPKEHPVKKTATLHALMNVGLVTLTGLNLLARSRRRFHRPTPALVALSGACTAGLAFSAWLGGEMVYELGMRVRGVDPTAGQPEIAPPGDEAVAQTLSEVEDAVPTPG